MQKSQSGKKQNQSNANEAFLISVNEGYSADLVEGGLRSAEIPFIKKGHGGPAGFFRYDTKYESLGVDFYVPRELLSRAKAALPQVDGVVTEEEGDDGQADSSAAGDVPTEEPKEASPFKRMLTVVLFIAAACLIIFGVDTIMNAIRRMMGY